MKLFGKLFGGLIIGGAIYLINRVSKTADTGKKMSVTILGVDKPGIKNAALQLSVNIAFDNPTPHSLNLKKPYVVAYFSGGEVGNSIPTNEHYSINANDRTTIKGINIQIPFLKLGSALVSLMSGNIPKMSFEISVSTEADGIPFTDKQTFNV